MRTSWFGRSVAGKAAIAGVAVVSMFTTAACGGDAEESSNEDPIRLLLVGGTTGPTSTVVAQAQAGIEAGISVVNADGGVDGRMLELSVLDDGGDPTRAVSALQQYLTQNDEPDVVFPGMSSAEALAMLPTLTRQGLFSINGTSATEINDPASYPYHFGYMPTNLEQQVGLPRDLREFGAEKVVAVVANDAYGKTLGDGVSELLESEGFEVSVESFAATEVDLSITFERALADEPDAIFMDAVGDAAHRLVETRAVVGATGIPTIVGSSIAATQGGPSNWASEAENEQLFAATFSAQRWLPEDERSPELQDFFASIEEAGGIEEGESTLVPAIFYDMVRIYAAAATDADTTDAAEVASVLENDPELPALVQWSSPGWTAESHFPSLAEGDVTVLPRSEIVDGLYKSMSE